MLDLTWRLLRGGGRRGLLGTWLTLGAVAVSTALLLFAVSANLAFEARADRGAWRNPVKTTGNAVAVQATRSDFVNGVPITLVELSALKPGLAGVPAPGQVWWSPALAALAKELPQDQLAKRFPGEKRLLEEETLVHPGELVAVVGRSTVAGGTKVASLAGTPSDEAVGYQILALIASVLMIVPLLVFGGAAARLTVARRDQRLAALRLIGATPGQVVAMTVVEAVLVAFAGALTGAVLYAAAAPLLTGIEIGGGRWFLADMFPNPLILAGVLLAVPLLVGLSAVVGLRRVVVSPLGVAKRETPPAMRFVRVLGLLAVMACVPLLSRSTSITVVVGSLALAFLCINLAGPWVVGLIGKITAKRARKPARLLAGRRLIDDPRSAWRTVSGVALTGFVAGFLGLLSPGDAFSRGIDDHQLRLTAPASAVTEVRDRLADAHVTATVKGTKSGVVIALGTGADQATINRARTALADVSPGHTATTELEDDNTGWRTLEDVRTGTVVVLAVSFLVAITSAGITAASSILDRRQTYALLRLAGTPLEVLDKARRAETMIPLVVMGGGSILVGVFCAAPFMLAAAISTTGLITLLTCVAVGFGGGLRRRDRGGRPEQTAPALGHGRTLPPP